MPTRQFGPRRQSTPRGSTGGDPRATGDASIVVATRARGDKILRGGLSDHGDLRTGGGASRKLHVEARRGHPTRGLPGSGPSGARRGAPMEAGARRATRPSEVAARRATGLGERGRPGRRPGAPTGGPTGNRRSAVGFLVARATPRGAGRCQGVAARLGCLRPVAPLIGGRLGARLVVGRPGRRRLCRRSIMRHGRRSSARSDRSWITRTTISWFRTMEIADAGATVRGVSAASPSNDTLPARTSFITKGLVSVGHHAYGQSDPAPLSADRRLVGNRPCRQPTHRTTLRGRDEGHRGFVRSRRTLGRRAARVRRGCPFGRSHALRRNVY